MRNSAAISSKMVSVLLNVTKIHWVGVGAAIVGLPSLLFFIGFVIIPMIIWEAYKIMLYITDGIVLKFDLVLCTAVVSAYTAVMLCHLSVVLVKSSFCK